MDSSSDDEVFLSDGAESGSEEEKTRQNSHRVLPDNETVMQMDFTSYEEAALFYINYGWEMGFDVRKCGNRIKNDVLKNNKWEYISAPQKAIMTLLRDAGIRTRQIINYLQQVEHSISFKKKDAYNFLGKERMDIIRNSDVKTTLSLFEGMQMVDPNLIIEKTCNDDKSLSRLFWCDGFSRAAYDKFGDVLVMDSTYKTNRYNFPLVILSGIDNHKKIVIFGAALMYKETAESYIWLLKTFLSTMGGKPPLSVVIDQDEAMRQAIKVVFPAAIHRLCGWHLSRNCAQKVQVHDFCTLFSKLMMARWSIEEFERN